MNHSINNFSFRYYNENGDLDKNYAFSPLGITATLAMCALGGQGRTLDEMNRLMSVKLEKLGNQFGKYFSSFHSNDTVSVASGLFINNKFKLLPKYEGNIKKKFKAEIKSLNFEDDPLNVCKEVNDWITSKTDQRITSILSKENFHSNSKILLFNTISFIGKWVNAFDRTKTVKSKFYKFNGKTDNVDMMHLTNSKFVFYPNVEDLDAQVIRIPYEGGKFSFIAIQPINPKNDLKTISKKLTSERFGEMLKEPFELEMSIHLPKFSINISNSLVEPLRKLGIVQCFTSEAIFTGISKEFGLQIDDITQNVFIKVEEEGTIAEAITEVQFVMLSANFVFNGNRPFLYFIYDEKEHIILFAGHYVQPE
ncbi:hypothetical protein SNEBB_010559 [Seison nebaliae]|nr:hypothetical protein SNEBB_010559 [Seison nebaliae]